MWFNEFFKFMIQPILAWFELFQYKSKKVDLDDLRKDIDNLKKKVKKAKRK